MRERDRRGIGRVGKEVGEERLLGRERKIYIDVYEENRRKLARCLRMKNERKKNTDVKERDKEKLIRKKKVVEEKGVKVLE